MDVKRIVTRFWKKTVLYNPTLFENINKELQEQILNLLPAAKNSTKNDNHSGLKSQRQTSSKEYEEKMITEMSWIQCDNCQKWRFVSNLEASRWCDADKKWFCKFNKDETRNDCNIEEDDFESIEKSIQKKGMMFVFPYLTPGDLVMAMMVGYCWWPAVINFDPFYDTYIEYEEGRQTNIEETVVHSYHVEFLGTTHSHAWIPYRYINLLDDSPQSLVSKIYKPKGKTHKSTYKGNSIKEALGEAKIFQKLSKSLRLKRCVFNRTRTKNNNYNLNKNITASNARREEHSFFEKPIPKFSLDKPKHSRLTQVKAATSTAVTTTATTTAPLTARRTTSAAVTERTTVAITTTATPTTTAAVVAAKSQNVKRIQEECIRCSRTPVKRRYSTDSEEDIISEYVERSSVESGSSIVYDMFSDPKTLQGSCRNQNSNPHQSSSTPATITPFGAKNTTLNMSLKEKLRQDIENYRNHEASFAADLKQFLACNNIHFEAATWDNITIDPYQLYCMVLDTGGYKTVTERKKWAEIYREVTNTFQKCKGSVVRSYYERNLLAYELYKSCNTNYKDVLKNIVAKGIIMQPKTKCEKQMPVRLLTNNSHTKHYTADDVSDTSSILMEQFNLLDQYSTSYHFEYEIFQESEKKLGADLKYYNDPSTYHASDGDYELLLGDTTSENNFTAHHTTGEKKPGDGTFEAFGVAE